MTCPSCRLVKYARVFPYHCECGQIHWGSQASQVPCNRARKPKTAGHVLRELVGCACNDLPWKQWNTNSTQWCIDHADEIAQAIAGEPKTGLNIDQAKERVNLAIRISQKNDKRD